MRTLILFIILCVSLSAFSQDVWIYKLVFSDAKESVKILDSTMIVATVQPSIIQWKQNFFGSDSTAVYEDGYFVDVMTFEPVDKLKPYIINPYPTKFNHCFSGVDETNAIFIKP
jgi:hypothetical protein